MSFQLYGIGLVAVATDSKLGQLLVNADTVNVKYHFTSPVSRLIVHMQARRNNFRAGYCCFFIVIAAVWLLGAVGTGILVAEYIVH